MSSLRKISVAALLLLAGLVFAGQVMAQEIIRNFESNIWVNPDASLTVREKITVISEGREIRRGIFRDIPTDYTDDNGNQFRVGLKIEKITRDGQPEPYHTERRSNGIRIYIGDKDVFIPDGQHTYGITYRTTRQIGFFDGYDEIYWNVTGNGWSFEIVKASARVHLPEGAPVLKYSGYIGFQGDKGTAFATRDFTDGMEFFTTRPLEPYQGLTIAVAFPSGYITQPSEMEKIGYLLADNQILLVGSGGLAILALYYFLVWWRVGRDPAAGTIVPLYEPPEGYSPAAMRYIREMGFDNKVFSAAIISMAVKGYLTIREDDSGNYILKRTGKKVPLSLGEKAAASWLLKGANDQIELKQKNHATIRKARDNLKEWLRTEYEKTYFSTNRIYFIPGVVISLIVVGLMLLSARDQAAALFISVWLTGWTAGVYFMLRRGYRAWMDFLSGRNPLSGIGAILLTVMAIPFLGGEIAGLIFFIDAASPAAAVLFLLLQVINLVFYHLLKAPTLLGRKMMDKFAGFADFLSVTEKDRMNFFNSPERTPELFERYLPFAIALDVENAWADQFSSAFANAHEGPWQRGSYRPSWYNGRHFNSSNLAGFSTSLGRGFTSAISSASTAPGSSSGSSGGGSSGGGGGGGGGGGW